jgi:hypothetical protein
MMKLFSILRLALLFEILSAANLTIHAIREQENKNPSSLNSNRSTEHDALRKNTSKLLQNLTETQRSVEVDSNSEKDIYIDQLLDIPTVHADIVYRQT